MNREYSGKGLNKCRYFPKYQLIILFDIYRTHVKIWKKN